MKLNNYCYAVIFLLLIISYYLYSSSDFFQLKCIISNIDGETYCVRERNKLNLAADKLATVNKNMKTIVNSCYKNYPDQDNFPLKPYHETVRLFRMQ